MTANYPNQSVSPWATYADICEPCTAAAAPNLDPADVIRQLQVASNLLFRLSGRQWAGINTDEHIRPLVQFTTTDHGRPVIGYQFGGSLSFGTVDLGMFRTANLGMANTAELPGGATVPEIRLGYYPVVDVPLITIDGQTLPRSAYRIDDDRKLVRLADPATGNNPGWPSTAQRIDLPPTAVGTWEVTVVYGMPPPPEGVDACVELACQLAMWRNPSTRSACQLPQRITHIARQGLTATVLDPQAYLDKGRLGLPLCDYFLSAVNPKGITRRATMRNVDVGRRVRRTGAAG